jgi:hypothetical protein
MAHKPGLDGRPFAVRQERDDPSSLEVAYDAAIAMVAVERPVVDADDSQRFSRALRSAPHDAEQRVVAHGQHQPLDEDRPWPAAKGETKVMDDAVEPCRSTRPSCHDAVIKSFGENPLATLRLVTAESARDKVNPNTATNAGQI